MKKSNNLRRIYMIYSIVLAEMFIAAIIICAELVPVITDLIYILGIIAAVIAPAAMYIFYRWRTRDNAASSDEMEQLVLTKAFALSGLVAVSLLPVLMALAFIFPGAAGFIVFGYAIVIGGALKLSAVIFNRRY